VYYIEHLPTNLRASQLGFIRVTTASSSAAAEEQYFVSADSKYIGIPWYILANARRTPRKLDISGKKAYFIGYAL